MPIKSTEVHEFTCDNPNCNTVKYGGPNNVVTGFVLHATERDDNDRTVAVNYIWACRSRCVSPAIKHAITEGWERMDDYSH